MGKTVVPGHQVADDSIKNADIASDAGISLSKLASIVNSRVLGRKGSGSGPIEEMTISELLDFIGSAVAGDLLYRGASTWARLAKGSDGDFLSLSSGLPVWSKKILCAVKTADETVNNSNSLQDDDHLSLTVEANSKYILRLYLVGDVGNSTPGLKCALTVPAGVTFSGSVSSNRTSTALLENNVTDLSNMLASNTWTNGANCKADISGTLVIGVNAGTVTLQWSQITAHASNTKISIGSYLLLIKV